jgi:orotidine-5'-phosphate decarboxylase
MNEKTLRIVPALDLARIDDALSLVQKLADHELVYGFKIGFSLGLRYGLPMIVNRIKEISLKTAVIYDHQKAGTDIPDTGSLFARTLSAAGVDEAIIFPQSGPNTLKAWVEALQSEGIKVIVGGLMTHPSYLASEGGFIGEEGVVEIYRRARNLGVNSFVVPLTKPEQTLQVVREAGLDERSEFFTPGLGSQGGDLSRFEFLEKHFVIVGRSLVNSDDPVRYIQDIERRVSIER